MEFDPVTASALLSQNTQNIALKLKKGGTLTAREREALQAAVEGVDSAVTGWADNTALLAKALGISRETLRVNLIPKWKLAIGKGEKCPRKYPNGRYLIREWRVFAAENLKHGLPEQKGAQGETAPSGGSDYLTRKEKMYIEKLQLEIDNEKRQQALFDKKYIAKDFAADEIRRCNEQVRNELTRRFRISAPAEYAQVQGDANECRIINDRHLQEVFEYLHTGSWPEE